MLGGDSEYSDIDVNSGEEHDEDSNMDQNERSFSGSNDLNDSKYSQSKPDDRNMQNASDLRHNMSRNHRMNELKK